MRSGGGRPARLSRLVEPGLAIVAFIVLTGAGPTTNGGDQGGGGGGFLSGLGPLLAVALVIGIVLAAVAALILFRTRGASVPPATDDWWTCANCGAANMDGAARCHACSTWRGTTPRPTPSASR